MENDMVKNIYKSPRRLRAKYTHRTNLAVYALDISPLRGAAELWGRHPIPARKTSTGCFQMYPADA